MLHLHHQIANLGLELFVLGFQLTLAIRWTIDQRIVAVMPEPSLDDASGDLMIARRLADADLARLDFRDQLTFEFGFELSTNLSHYEYRSPQTPAHKIGVREG